MLHCRIKKKKNHVPEYIYENPGYTLQAVHIKTTSATTKLSHIALPHSTEVLR